MAVVPRKQEWVGRIASLSVVIPVYNEREILGELLDSVLTVFDCRYPILEIVVVDDGSCDDSAGFLCQRAAEDPRIRVMQHGQNQGKGAALRTGLMNSTGEWVLCIDADLQVPLNCFDEFEQYSGKAEVLIGYRRNKRYSWWRILVSRMYRQAVGLLFDLGVKDIGCPFKLYRGNVVRGLTIGTSGFAVDVDLLWQLRRKGIDIIELPVETLPRRSGVSKVTLRSVAGCIAELFRLRVHQ